MFVYLEIALRSKHAIKAKNMKSLLIIILTLVFLTNCNNPQTKSVGQNDRLELLPEPDKAERLRYEAIEKLKKSNCSFMEPDSSVSGIILRNAESAAKVIGNNKMNNVEEYKFYSKLESETLTLIQHPGDDKNQISIFKIEKSTKASYGFKELNLDNFKTEKGIKLGLTKKQVIEKLGNCYAPIDSTKNYIELYYLIEQPKDSKSKILKKNNMPVYFASYKFWNDRLEKFEFGFEYP